MANPDTPFGFIPLRHLGGGVIRSQEFPLASAYAVTIFSGDSVVITSGKLAIGAQDSAAILGIFDGCSYVDSAGNQVFSRVWVGATVTLASADAVAYVYVDPMISYKVQVDTGSTFAIASHVGVAYDMEADQVGNLTTGQSGQELDLNDTGTGQWTVIGLVNDPTNAVGVNAKVEVINNVPLVGN